jgi:hypothetical protein
MPLEFVVIDLNEVTAVWRKPKLVWRSEVRRGDAILGRSSLGKLKT